MAAQQSDGSPRAPLSRDRVLRAAVTIADTEGLAALTMRRLGQELGVEAMSLYHHVRGKDALLSGAVETVLDDVNAAVDGLAAATGPDDWQDALRTRILTARAVMLRHRWAPRVLEDQTSIALAAARYYEGILAIMVAGGLSYDLAHHAMHALGSRALGFSQELFEPDDVEAGDADANAMLEQMADQLPHLVAMAGAAAHDAPENTIGWCDDDTEFAFTLDLLLEGLERRRIAEAERPE